MTTLLLFTSMKEGTEHLEQIHSYATLWKGNKTNDMIQFVDSFLDPIEWESFDPWEDHHSLIIQNGMTIFIGWKVELQSGIIIFNSILSQETDISKFLNWIWSFTHTSAKYWDELLEELIDQEEETISKIPIDITNHHIQIDFEDRGTFINKVTQFFQDNIFAILFSPHVLIDAEKMEFEVLQEVSLNDLEMFYNALNSSNQHIKHFTEKIVFWLSFKNYEDRTKEIQKIIKLVADLLLLDSVPSMAILAKHAEMLSNIDKDHFLLLVQQSIQEFKPDLSISVEDLIRMADIVYKDSQELAFMIAGLALEFIFKDNSLDSLVLMAKTISHWNTKQMIALVETLASQYPSPTEEQKEILTKVYDELSKDISDPEGIESIANAYCTIGRQKEAVLLRLKQFDKIEDETDTFALVEVIKWAIRIPGIEDKELAEIIAPYFLTAMETSPAGPYFPDQIGEIYEYLEKDQKKILILAITTQIVKNIDLVPILEQSRTLEIVKGFLKNKNDFLDLVAIVNAKLHELLMEEGKESKEIVKELFSYIETRRGSKEIILPIIEKMLVTTAKFGSVETYTRVLDFIKTMELDIKTRHRIFEMMDLAAKNAVSFQLEETNKELGIQIYYDILSFAIINEDSEILAQIMEHAVQNAIEIDKREAIIDFSKGLFTFSQIAGIQSWVGKMNELMEKIVENGKVELSKVIFHEIIELAPPPNDKEQLIEKQLDIASKIPDYLSPDEETAMWQNLLAIFNLQQKYDEILETVERGYHAFISHNRPIEAFHFLIDAINVLDRDDFDSLEPKLIDSYLSVIDFFENEADSKFVAKTLYNLFTELLNHVSKHLSRLNEAIEITISELIIRYIKTKDVKQLEYANIFLTFVIEKIPIEETLPILIKSFDQIIRTRKKFDPKYSLFNEFMDRLRFLSATRQRREGLKELRKILYKFKKAASKDNKIKQEMIIGIYLIGSFYFQMDCDFDEQCKIEIQEIAVNYFEAMIGLSKKETGFTELIHELYEKVRRSPSEIRTIVFHLDRLINSYEEYELLLAR